MNEDSTGTPARRFGLSPWTLGTMAGLACFLAILTILYLLPFKYEASANFLVRVNRDTAVAPAIGGPTNDQIVVTGVRAEDVASEIEILTSRGVAEMAYDKLGAEFFADERKAPQNWRQRIVFALREAATRLFDGIEALLVRLKMAKEMSPREEAIADLENAIEVSRSVRSDVIGLSMRWSSSEEALRVLNAVSDSYLEAHRNARRVYRGEALFAELRNGLDSALTQTASQIETLKSEIGTFNAPLLIDEVTQQMARSAAELAETETLIAQLGRELAMFKTRRSDIEAMRSSSEPKNTSDILSNIREKLVDLEARLQAEISRYGDRTDQARELTMSIASVEADLRAADLAHTDRDIQRVENDLATARLRHEQLSGQIAANREKLAVLSRGQAKIRALELKRTSDEKNFTELSTEAARAAWLSRLDTEDVVGVSLLGPTTAPDVPVSPNKILILLAGLIVSVALAAAIALGLKNLDTIREWALRLYNPRGRQMPEPHRDGG